MRRKTYRILIMVLLVFMLTSCESNNNSIINTVSSSDGKYTAYVFIRDMGATTKESYQLSVFKSDKKLGNSVGNAFVSDGEFTVEWIDERTLFVDNNAAQIYKQKTKINGITINYEHLINK